MIGDWTVALPSVLVGIVLMFVPGAAALLGVGMRGLPLLAFAPVMSVAMTGVSALVLSIAGFAWSPWTLGASLVLLIALAWVVGWGVGRLRSSAASAGDARWMLPVAIAVGAFFGAWRLIAYIGEPAAISQTNDAVFHLNAVRYILETSDASSLHVSSVIGARSFYPAAWHAFASMIALITGADIALVANALTVIIGAVVWTLGITWLTRVLTGSARVAGFAAVFSSALQAFPLLMFQWGVLYPNALSTALIPAGLAVTVSLPRWLRRERPARSTVLGLLIGAVTAGALALSQPAAMLAWGLLACVWFTFWMLSRATPRLIARVVLVLAAWAMLASVWFRFSNGTSGSHWDPFRGNLEVFADVLLNSQMGIPAAFGMSILMLVGLVSVMRNRSLWWFAAGWLAISGLYVLVAAVDLHLVRDGLLASWYADPYRIAALAPIVVVPLAAIGFDALVRWAARPWRRASSPSGSTTVSVIALVIAVLGMLILVLLRSVAMPQYMDRTFELDSRYAADPERFGYLDPDERALLESLGEYVPEGERVIGNPGTGSGFGYVLSGYDVFPRTWSPPNTEDWALIGESLRDAAEDPDVCDALETYGSPQYVLDFGPGEERAGRWLMPGMTDFAEQDGFEFVAERGDASLWRITACAE